MQPGFFCNSGASLLLSCLLTTTLWGSLCSSLLTTLLWSCLCSSFLTTTLWSSLCCSLLTTTLWCCLRSSFLTTLCSHVDFLSEWFDPSPNLFRANRDSNWQNFPLFEVIFEPCVSHVVRIKVSTFRNLRPSKTSIFTCKKWVFGVFAKKPLKKLPRRRNR